MEISKIILTVKENHVGLKQIGASDIKLHVSKSTSSKVAALEAFSMLMDSIDTNATISDVVAHVFLPDVIYKPLINGTIASYIREGKTRKGTELSLEELKLYDEVFDKYLLRAKNLVPRNSDFNALDKLKETTIKNEIRNCYLVLDKEIKKSARPTIINNAPVISESTKRTIEMLNNKIEEAAMNGDIDAMERFVAMISKLESGAGSAGTTPSSVETSSNDNTQSSVASNTESNTDVEDIEDTSDTTTTAEGEGFTLSITKNSEQNIPAGLAAFKKLG